MDRRTEARDAPIRTSGQSTYPDDAGAAVAGLPAGCSRIETADDYPTVVALNSRWRVIVCRDGFQWILQCRDRRPGARYGWRGRSYCRQRESLLRCVREHCDEVNAAAVEVLHRLPDWIEEVAR